MANRDNVTTGKPSISGAVYIAPLETALPTDATTELSADFTCLGYVSEDGLTNSNSPDSGEIKAWGGDSVYSYVADKKDTFAFTLIEALNIDVLKVAYGDENVSGSLDTGITIKSNSKEMTAKAWVFELILRNNALKRICVPCASVTAIGDIVYKDADAVGYATTITASADSLGNTHYEYIVKGGNE